MRCDERWSTGAGVRQARRDCFSVAPDNVKIHQLISLNIWQAVKCEGEVCMYVDRADVYFSEQLLRS